MRSPVFSRRAVIAAGSAAVVGIPTIARAAEPAVSAGVDAAFPAQSPSLVREIVGASHRDIDRVRQLLTDAPQLANAAYDWGFGDWETPLGAAAHTGRREIAQLLLDHGARPDVFAMAMLGELEVVRSMIACLPGLQKRRGPHGLSLLHHAQAGGEPAAGVAAYLTELGNADPTYEDQPLSEPQKQQYIGEYSYGPGKDERFRVFAPPRGSQLAFQRADRPQLRLFHQGDHAFLPAGGNDVRLVFAVSVERATACTITTPARLLTAVRV